MPPTYFPLRWESTGDQWWFASPIDWAAANGHYDLVRELLHIDTNLLIKLTSLRRIRRLETVWDDEDRGRSNDVAKCRSQVAHKLLQECETNEGYNSLIRAGYGGWLLYSAASAGDLMFVKQMLDRDPILVFGEGEFGVTDMLYAAARSRSCEVFRLLLDCAMSPKGQQVVVSSVFRWEMMNRAVHAAARGGNIDMLRELLKDCHCHDVLAYRDEQGSTLLHAASSRGQVEVVQYLISSYDIVGAVDNRGNTALHVAAHRAQLAVMEALASTASMTNNDGDTFLHMVVAGFSTRGFHRMDKQMELMKQLVAGKTINVESIINVANNDGRTALHMAVTAGIQSELVELLMSVPCIDLNGHDAPVGLLRQRRQSAGGICDSQKQQSATGLHHRMHGIGVSPGTSFRIPDGEIILHVDDYTSTEMGEIESKEEICRLSSHMRRLKILLSWAGKDRNAIDATDSEDNCSIKPYRVSLSAKNSPVSLRQQFSRPSNKRILSLQGNQLLPSLSARKKFTTAGVRQVLPKSNLGSPLSVYSEWSWSDKGKCAEPASESSPGTGPSMDSSKTTRRKLCSFNLRKLLLFGGGSATTRQTTQSS